MSSKPNNVITFLNRLSDKLREKLSTEKQLLQDAKNIHENTIAEFEIWDRDLYKRDVSRSFFSSNSNIDEFFTVENTLQGAIILAKALFGLIIREEKISPLESWHQDVRKLIVECEKEGIVG